jgi:hypothetical protein
MRRESDCTVVRKSIGTCLFLSGSRRSNQLMLVLNKSGRGARAAVAELTPPCPAVPC